MSFFFLLGKRFQSHKSNSFDQRCDLIFKNIFGFKNMIITYVFFSREKVKREIDIIIKYKNFQLFVSLTRELGVSSKHFLWSPIIYYS